ncbi:hypothetical protein PybrP1_012796 [[Pythium] brassicae (nom. inval.)]|nr:hypothetical protein PybrP1_012796 [[Pythium] brassicae (nom. inval.)]
MMHTSEPHTREEAATLLEEQRVAAAPPRRRQALRTLIGVLGTVALVAGAVVAVEMATNGGDASAAASVNAVANVHTAPHTMVLNTRAQPSAFEARFGWGSFKSGWCSIRANAGCLFSGDREKCKQEVHDACDPKPEPEPTPAPAPPSDGHGSSSGNGSGSGSDSSDSDDNSGSGSKTDRRLARSSVAEAGFAN